MDILICKQNLHSMDQLQLLSASLLSLEVGVQRVQLNPLFAESAICEDNWVKGLSGERAIDLQIRCPVHGVSQTSF